METNVTAPGREGEGEGGGAVVGDVYGEGCFWKWKQT